MDAHNGAFGTRTCIEVVPSDWETVFAVEGSKVGPRRVKLSCFEQLSRGADEGRHKCPDLYQRSSAAAQLSPEPMPMSSTRSPSLISFEIVDKV